MNERSGIIWSECTKGARLVERGTTEVRLDDPARTELDRQHLREQEERLASKGVDIEAYRAGLAASATSIELPADPPSPVEYFDPASIKASRRPGGLFKTSPWWREFAARYPEDWGYLTLTRLGFHEGRAVLLASAEWDNGGAEVLVQLKYA